MEPVELFKPVVGYEGYYEVSNLGRVKRLPREVTWLSTKNGRSHYTTKQVKERIMPIYGWSTQGSIQKAYDMVQLCKNGKQKRYYVHTLVAQAFLDNSQGYRYVRHLDGDGHNNCVENLCWADNTCKIDSKI